MIVKTPYGLSPSFNLTIGGAAVDYQSINAIVVEMESNKHDLVTFEMSGLPTRAVTEYRTKPVQLTFNTGPGYNEQFVGYIVEVCPFDKVVAGYVNGSPFQDASVKCIGASYIMRGAKSQQWATSTIENVAKEFARRYGFSLDVPRIPVIWPSIIQDNESDWQFLVRYAGLMGLHVSAHNTHLHVYDPQRAAERQVSFNRLITASRGVSAAPGKISDFKGSFADRQSNGLYKNTVVTVRQSNGVTFDVSSQDIFNVTGKAVVEERLSASVDSYAEAEFTLRSHSKDTYDYEAQVTVGGLAGCQPGGIVDLQKYNAEYDGLWYVEGVKHTITSGAFLSELSLRKNSVSELDNPNRASAKFQAPPEPKFDGVAWRSSKKEVYRVY